ncbi:MAG: response regulator transcription factor [Acidimicrobiia bacterium]|nr:response regulator transcription factor [Acidimicrobiia bacterium]
MRILVIEDEDTIAGAIAARLRSEGFDVDIADDGPSGVEAAERLIPDLVVLDLMLPGFDGFEACRRIQRHRRVPVLMLTAKDTETDMLVGLGLGADDYMTKPFSQRELVARVQAILRRVRDASEPAPSAVVRIGDIELDRAARRVRRADAEVHLTPTEFDLLVCLVAANGAVLTRDQLLRDVWGYRDGSGARTVDSHVRAMRRKLGDDVIRTVHAVGYAIGDLS